MTRADKRARQKERTRQAREAREAALKRQRRKTAAIRFGIAAVVVVAGIFVISLITGDDGDDAASDTSTTVPTDDTTTDSTLAPAAFDPTNRCAPAGGSGEPEVELDPNTLYTATITTNKGEIVAELDTMNAPIGASHFIKLANEGFYDGLTWHRVIDGFMIQGGDPNGDGTGGSGTPVGAEPSTNGYPLGSLAAAKTATDPAGTFDAQFFVTTGDQGVALPNDYACFGQVTSGFEVAQDMSTLGDPAASDAPTEELTIDSVAITESPRATDTTTTTIAG